MTKRILEKHLELWHLAQRRRRRSRILQAVAKARRLESNTKHSSPKQIVATPRREKKVKRVRKEKSNIYFIQKRKTATLRANKLEIAEIGELGFWGTMLAVITADAEVDAANVAVASALASVASSSG